MVIKVSEVKDTVKKGIVNPKDVFPEIKFNRWIEWSMKFK